MFLHINACSVHAAQRGETPAVLHGESPQATPNRSPATSALECVCKLILYKFQGGKVNVGGLKKCFPNKSQGSF